MENWIKIINFEQYSVSDLGRVRNDNTGDLMTILYTKHKAAYVGLNKDGVQARKSLPKLVGDAFVPVKNPHMDRLIHRDTDLTNNRADNLLRRPHWFVIKYALQAKRGKVGSDVPVVEKKLQEIYPNSWEASLAFGLLELDLISSIINRTVTWPTFQEFLYKSN